MYKMFLVLLLAASFTACNNEKKVDAASETKDAKPAMTLAYTPAYSSSFEMGKPEYATMIVQGSWKDWEMNKMANMRSWVADTIIAFQSNNMIANGVDSLQARWQRDRDAYASVVDTIDAVMSVYSTDRKENWVLVWARDFSVDKTTGKADTMALMETWRINKDGKADRLYQFDRHTRKK